MRTLFRLMILALAALGAKTLYVMYRDRSDDLKRVGSDLFDQVGAAARDVGAQAGEAGHQVSDALRQGAAAVKTTAQDRAADVQAAVSRSAEQAKTALADETAEAASNGETPART
jgi:hypothetical protein